jgi:hypothetical protein
MADNLFERKDIKDFSEKIQKVFHLMTISRKVRVVGSAGFKNIRYASDYDLQELFKRNFDTDEALNLIYKMFKDKFARAEKDPTIFITDFKCGMDTDGRPLRWDKHDIKKGTKQLEDGRIIKFQDCILQKTTMKIDVVKIIDGVFAEFSDNYSIKLGNEANFFPHDISTDHIANSLKHSYDEYFYVYRNLFKGLKRAFSYYILTGEGKHHDILKKLMDFFNTWVGKFYQIKGQVGTLLLVLENKHKFRTAKISDIKRNIKLIIDAVKQCETSGLRAITVFGKRKINGYTAETIVDVTCGPKYYY